jgi:ArsR family transcriptional regulator
MKPAMNVVVDPLPALKAVADPGRLRLLRLLDEDELTVGELARCTGMPQSSVSRHLAVLRRASLVGERSEGVRAYAYLVTEPPAEVAPLLSALLDLVRRNGAEHAADLERLEALRREREGGREAVFDALADDWDALRAQLLGGHLAPPELASLLLPAGMRIVDAGAGTGVLLPWLSALAGPDGRVIAVESSAAMVRRAKRRAAGLGNVDVRRGRIEELPVEAGWADAVLLSLSLGHLGDPAHALRSCVAALRPGGRLAVADVVTHGDKTLVRRLGRGFAGFAPARLAELLQRAGLTGVRRVDLPAPADHDDEHNGASRRARTLDIRPLEPLFVVGVAPRRRRGRKK